MLSDLSSKPMLCHANANVCAAILILCLAKVCFAMMYSTDAALCNGVLRLPTFSTPDYDIQAIGTMDAQAPLPHGPNL